MKGKTSFTRTEAESIRKRLEEVRRADRGWQKKLRNELRTMGLYISDFTSSSKGFTPADFDVLVESGKISIL